MKAQTTTTITNTETTMAKGKVKTRIVAVILAVMKQDTAQALRDS